MTQTDPTTPSTPSTPPATPLHRDHSALILMTVVLLAAVVVAVYSMRSPATGPETSSQASLEQSGNNMREAGSDLQAVLGGLNSALSKR